MNIRDKLFITVIFLLFVVLIQIIIINKRDVQIRTLVNTVSICYDSIDMTNKAENKDTDDFIYIDLSETEPTAEELMRSKEMRDSYDLIISEELNKLSKQIVN